jgi:transposase
MTSHDPDFWSKAADVCGLYLNPPENAVGYSIDKRSGMQAKSRKNPTMPATPGMPARQEFEYVRHGTAVLYAALEVHDGGVDGWVTDSTRSDNFASFLSDLVAQTPQGLELHCVVDNLSAHSTKAVEEFLDDPDHCHVFLHNTPTHASWLNQVELFLSILSRRLLRHGEFDSVDGMADRIVTFIDDYNRFAKPFRWTYDARPLQVA